MEESVIDTRCVYNQTNCKHEIFQSFLTVPELARIKTTPTSTVFKCGCGHSFGMEKQVPNLLGLMKYAQKSLQIYRKYTDYRHHDKKKQVMEIFYHLIQFLHMQFCPIKYFLCMMHMGSVAKAEMM